MTISIKEFLIENADADNARFQSKLINTKYKILGIKIKIIENFAKNNAKELENYDFSNILYHEEVLAWGFIIAYSDLCSQEKAQKLKKLLPFIDNWATCDSIIPRMKNLESEKSFF